MIILLILCIKIYVRIYLMFILFIIYLSVLFVVFCFCISVSEKA